MGLGTVTSKEKAAKIQWEWEGDIILQTIYTHLFTEALA